MAAIDDEILETVSELRRLIVVLDQHIQGKIVDKEVNQPLNTDQAVCSRIIDKFNRAAKRNLRWENYLSLVTKLRKKGYREGEMRIVIWWAFEIWKPEEIKPHPRMLFKLQSGQGYRTFPEYLAEAIEAFESTYKEAWDCVDQEGYHK